MATLQGSTVCAQTKLKELFWLHLGSYSPIINTAHPGAIRGSLQSKNESFGSMAPRHVLYSQILAHMVGIEFLHLPVELYK